MENLLSRLRKRAQRGGHGVRAAYRAESQHEGATGPESCRPLEREEPVERSAGRRAGTAAGRERRQPVDNGVGGERRVAVSRTQRRQSAKSDVLVDERANQFVHDLRAVGRGLPPEAQDARGGVVERIRCGRTRNEPGARARAGG